MFGRIILFSHNLHLTKITFHYSNLLVPCFLWVFPPCLHHFLLYMCQLPFCKPCIINTAQFNSEQLLHSSFHLKLLCVFWMSRKACLAKFHDIPHLCWAVIQWCSKCSSIVHKHKRANSVTALHLSLIGLKFIFQFCWKSVDWVISCQQAYA